jgi:hypothetical protein
VYVAVPVLVVLVIVVAVVIYYYLNRKKNKVINEDASGQSETSKPQKTEVCVSVAPKSPLRSPTTQAAVLPPSPLENSPNASAGVLTPRPTILVSPKAATSPFNHESLRGKPTQAHYVPNASEATPNRLPTVRGSSKVVSLAPIQPRLKHADFPINLDDV